MSRDYIDGGYGMASNLKLGLRAYSFSLRKWHSKRPDKVYDLNKEILFLKEDGEEIRVENALALFEDFITANEAMSDKENANQLFSCGHDSIDKGETSGYSYLIFSVFSIIVNKNILHIKIFIISILLINLFIFKYICGIFFSYYF